MYTTLCRSILLIDKKFPLHNGTIRTSCFLILDLLFDVNNFIKVNRIISVDQLLFNLEATGLHVHCTWLV